MRKNNRSLDGFVSRNSGRSIGNSSSHPTLGIPNRRANLGRMEGVQMTSGTLPVPVSKQEIDASLRDIDDENYDQPRRRRGLFGRRKEKKPISRRRKIIKRIIIFIVTVLLLIGGYLGIQAWLASSQVFQGNLFSFFENKPLKTDANGRTNILIYGTSGSVKDHRHDGADLTDSIMLLSVDQKAKNAYMVSFPRDLWVDYGAACTSGYQGKINVLWTCYSNGGENEQAGANALEKQISAVTGMSIQYYAHVNWAVLVSAVNAVGGVDVDVKGDGECYAPYTGGVVDANMKIAYKGGVHHMNGVQALSFSRARGDIAPNCGVDRGDYDRQLNQQKVIKALQAKALSAGTLTNVGKVSALMDSFGKNLRTDFQTSEIQTLMRLGKEISGDKIVSVPLVGDGIDLIGGQMINGQSAQVPTAGQGDYSAIKTYLRKKIYAGAIEKENALVALYNGSGIEGYAADQKTTLENDGFTVSSVANAPSGTYGTVEIYDLTNGKKPSSIKKLESIYSVTAKKTTSPITAPSGTSIVVVFGRTSGSN